MALVMATFGSSDVRAHLPADVPAAASAAFAITTSTVGATSPHSALLVSKSRRHLGAQIGSAHEGIGFARRAYLVGMIGQAHRMCRVLRSIT
jgi:hypothetical protein